MRLSVSLIALALLGSAACTGAAVAGEPYEPIALLPADSVTVPPDLARAADELLDAVQTGDIEAAGALIADTVTWVDGALEMGLPRYVETVSDFASAEGKLMELASYTGGDVQMASGPDDKTPYAINAERDFIKYSLMDAPVWGTDPMVPGAICTYGYRSYDVAALAALADRMGIFSSSFFYVDVPSPLQAAPQPDAETTYTLAPDRLYALDYKTDAPGHWIAVHLPEGGEAFLNFDAVEMQKPYAVGICFAETDKGWQMVAQVSTSL